MQVFYFIRVLEILVKCRYSYYPFQTSFLLQPFPKATSLLLLPFSNVLTITTTISRRRRFNSLLDRVLQLDTEPGDLRDDEPRLQRRVHRHPQKDLLLLLSQQGMRRRSDGRGNRLSFYQRRLRLTDAAGTCLRRQEKCSNHFF
jgi:hypothetical protein